MLAALLFVFSHILDFGLSYLHPAVATYYPTLLFAILLGAIPLAFSHRIGLALLGFNIWMALSIPLSVWPGGSAATVKNAVLLGLGVYLAIAGLVRNYDDLRRTIHVLVYSVTLLALVAVFGGVIVDGRLTLGGGTYGNPNDLAQIMLIVVPFVWYMMHTPLSSRFRRGAAVLLLGLLMVMMVRTGSRGALIAFVVTAGVVFFHSSAREKFVLFVLGALLLVGAGLILPDYIERRYFTFFEAKAPVSVEESESAGAAIGSSLSRWTLLKDSMALTIQHPLLGVGAGQFQNAQDDMAQKRGELKGQWLLTHNSYTQVSSEGGVPAFLFYAATLVFCFAGLRRPIRSGSYRDPVLADVVQLSLALRASLVAYAVSTCFISAAYTNLLPVLAGLIVVFDRTVYERIQRGKGARPPAPPVSRLYAPGLRRKLGVSAPR
jgi:O-antigen ligase